MSYELIWEPHGVVKRFWGHVSDDDIISSVNKVCGDSRFDDLRYVLNDLTSVESQSVSEVAIEDYAAERIGALRCNPSIVSPFVAASPSALAIATAVTAPLLGTEHPWKIFPSLAEARSWLATYDL